VREARRGGGSADRSSRRYSPATDSMPPAPQAGTIEWRGWSDASSSIAGFSESVRDIFTVIKRFGSCRVGKSKVNLEALWKLCPAVRFSSICRMARSALAGSRLREAPE
jgi:hypothetical protein